MRGRNRKRRDRKRISANRKRKLWKASKGKCRICGREIRHKGDPVNIDHIVPVSRGGKQTFKNMALTHARCNVQKGNRTDQELRDGVSKAVAMERAKRWYKQED